MRGLALACAVLAAVPAFLAAPAESSAQGADASLRRTLAQYMNAAGSASGAYVLNGTERRALFGRRADARRTLASNTKLFTTAAALARFGPGATLATEVLGAGELREDGVFDGDIYLRGGGDPTFGSDSFVERHYGRGATVEALARELERIGFTSITGRVLGDESLFDSLRGGPASGFRPSLYVGPLSALIYNRGLASERGTAFQANPPAFAAARLDNALGRRGIPVRAQPRAGRAPSEAAPLATVKSPAMSRLTQITNKRSDNFFAETLLKRLGTGANGRGSTAAGARVAARFARRLGVRSRLVDGSGLSRANRASPRGVARLLDRLRRREEFDAFFDSLAIAGRDGTLRDRMRRGPARRRCRGKTGTLAGVSALSGYCRSRGGDTLVFSFLMSSVNVTAARRLQDRMAHALARYRG
jgi:D-alanyl-D-alanine carboxypeptidase/D-alanyl-D-alanine-endopeptidase (penicillin-binding protein 4)